MAELPFVDATRLLSESRVPVIIVPRHASIDVLASGLGLLVALKKRGRTATMVCEGFAPTPRQSFLPAVDRIKPALENVRRFSIILNTNRTKVDSLSYDTAPDRLTIFITPRSGAFNPQDVTTSSGPFTHDLIIILGAASLQELGPLFELNAEFFYQTPTIVIDHRAQHTRFGQVNLVDVVASSCAEVAHELIERLDPACVDEQVATCFLTGIMANTRGFQHPAITPRALSISSNLITRGARREEITRSLFQTKTISALRLWGRILGNIQTSPDGRVMWSSVTPEDFRKTGSGLDEVNGIIHEMMMSSPAAKIAAIFVQHNGEVFATIGTQSPQNLELPDWIAATTPTEYKGRVSGQLQAVIQDVLRALEVTRR